MKRVSLDGTNYIIFALTTGGQPELVMVKLRHVSGSVLHVIIRSRLCVIADRLEYFHEMTKLADVNPAPQQVVIWRSRLARNEAEFAKSSNRIVSLVLQRKEHEVLRLAFKESVLLVTVGQVGKKGSILNVDDDQDGSVFEVGSLAKPSEAGRKLL